MANFIEPQYTKSQVTRAGSRVSKNEATLDDLIVVETWRASHAWVINTFQANLRRRSRGQNIIVGTRLKRRATIFNKLNRFPNMQLARMHDVAGCRVIFNDVPALFNFRQEVHRARFSHKRKNVGDERWNYIDNPKDDGYRGIHDVYEYDTRSAQGGPWKGLSIEIQYRTLLQHSWATAVEVAGLLTHNNPKFGQGEPAFVEFFAVASELLARHFEDMNSCLPDMSNDNLKQRLIDLEQETRILQLFRNVNSKVVNINFKMNNILLFPFVVENKENESDLEVFSFSNLNHALEKYSKLEKDHEGKADVVLVRADNFENMRITFRNYFADTTDFVSHVDAILDQ
ncbi:MAG: RelA/SpoT domain-containing protein [Blastomonas fulva]|nr:RelA/SpoT domain-containing protein [Blastomonas fulva]